MIPIRLAVRQFLQEELAAGSFTPRPDAWLKAHSPEFSRKLGARGWLGMTWPRQWGGSGRTPFERFTVNEELLAAGAPVAAHWVAENQVGPLLLNLGTPEQQKHFLPPIARGELYVAAGLSEPDSGSDLASIRTRATGVADGWRVTGRKVWSSNAHRNQYLLALVRTSPRGDNRHDGLSQFFIDLRSPGVEVRPIPAMGETAAFAEVVLDDVHVPASMVLGTVGSGWQQVTSMLVYERSGPERYLSTFPLLTALVGAMPFDERATSDLGSLAARLWATRALAARVQGLVEAGHSPELQGAMVKDLGAHIEQEVVAVARRAIADSPREVSATLRELLEASQCAAPGFTIRGGTVQVLRNVIARGLGK